MSLSPPISRLSADGFSTFPLWHAIHMLNEEVVVQILTIVGICHVLNYRYLYLVLLRSTLSAKKLTIIRILLFHSADVNAINDLGKLHYT